MFYKWKDIFFPLAKNNLLEMIINKIVNEEILEGIPLKSRIIMKPTTSIITVIALWNKSFFSTTKLMQTVKQ